MANPSNLSPDLLAYMRALQAPTQYGQSGAAYARDGFTPVFNQSWAASPETGQGPSGDGSLMSIVGAGRNPEENAEYNPQTGEFQKYYTVKDEFMGMNPMLAFALASAGLASLPGGLLSGSLGGAGAAGEGGLLTGAEGAGTLAGGAAGDTLGTGVFNAAMDSQLANLAMPDALSGYLLSGATPAAVNLGSAAAGSGLGSLLGEAGKFVKENKTLLGGLLGAAASKDQTTSASKDPWAPAQPYLLDAMQKASSMYGDKLANPFTAEQQQAYTGLQNVLNTANSSMPTLLQGMQANASGANNYTRKRRA